MQHCKRLALAALIVALAVPPLSAQSNYAIEFDGSNDYVKILVDPVYYAAPGFTWEMWFRMRSQPTNWHVLLCFVDGANMEDLALGFGFRSTGQKLAFEIDGAGTPMSPLGYTPPGGWLLDTWYHVAAVRNFAADSVKMYINGVLAAEAAFTGAAISRSICTESGIGYGFQDCNNQTWYFHGAIDDVRIWSRARHPDEIQRDMYSLLSGNEAGLCAYWPFEEGSGTTTSDRTSGANHGTLMNGAQWVNSTISPPTPPAAPSGLSAVAVSPTKVRLTWSDNSTSESRFVIERLAAPGTWARIDSVAANTVTHIVSNLAASTTHTFRVQAANGYFFSAYTNSADATTPAFLPPTSLQATPVSIDEVRLRWQDNAEGESHYVVERKRGDGAWMPVDTVPANTVDVVVSGMVPSTEYQFRVKALEDAAASEYSNVASAKTRDFLPPTELGAEALSFEAVQLRWKDNTEFESEYVIEMQEQAGAWVACDTVSANTTGVVIGGLSASTSYVFRVRARKNTIHSAYSNTDSVKTKSFLSAPINLAATVLSQTEVRLSWEDRSPDETGFEIELHLEGEGFSLAHTTAADMISHTFSDLLPDTTYTFRVRAVGDGAASSWSNEAVAGTFTAPLPPLDLDAAATGHESVSVRWSRGSANEMGFEIERRHSGASWTVVHTTGRGSMQVADLGLEERTTYWYRVRAINSLGVSDWSEEDSATTFAIPLPLAPFGLHAVATGSMSIDLTWIAASQSYERGFEVHESRTANPDDFVRVVPDAPEGARKYERKGLQPSTTYYYRIRALNSTGVSDWSKTVSATTLQQNIDAPGDPFSLTATAISTTEIGLAWEMPVPSKEDGFMLEQSLTPNEADFVTVNPYPGKGARSFTVSGLNPGTTYWYRLRAYNAQAYSQYSNIASATTAREPLSVQLATALQAKEALFPALENLIGAGDAEIAALRNIFGDCQRGYDEEPARTLIDTWRTAYPNDQTRAAETMERYAFFEQALGSAFRDTKFTPPVEGAWEIARQASGATAVLAKDACALALAWTSQRGAMGKEDPYVDAATEDLLVPVAQGAEALLALMGADDGAAVTGFAEAAIRGRGAVGGVSSRTLLSVFGYWQGRMAGRYYLSATQPLVARFAETCAQLDIGDTRQSAVAKRDGFVLGVRDRTNALALGYTNYANICTGLDAGFVIGQTTAPTREVYLQRLVQLRPRLVDGMRSAISAANIPVERFLYLTSTAGIPGLDPLPHALEKAGEAIFHPELPGSPALAESNDGGRMPDGPIRFAGQAVIADPAIEDDRAALVALREKVVAADAAYGLARFDALRAGGREMTAAVARAERPLYGIAPAALYGRTALQAEVHSVLARSALLRTRRTVLSVALADYGLAPTSPKQAALVAEIDSIIGTIDGVLAGLADLKSGQAGSLIILPVLSFADAEIVRDEAAGPTRYRLRFAVRNDGGASSAGSQAALSVLTPGVTAQGSTTFALGDIGVSTTARDSLALEIPAGVTAVSFGATLTGGGRTFTERRTLPVPQGTSAVEDADGRPSAIVLHQNHPNPFRPRTTLRYTLERGALVTLVVSDALGRAVARPVSDERREAGTHEVVFDASGLPSGVYLYRLEAMGGVQVRRMLLLR